MGLFHIHGRFGAEPLSEDVQRDHQAYIRSHIDRLRYGGVMLNGEARAGVCIVVEFESLAEAEAFAAGDPYRPLYTERQVSAFAQRIPPPDGEE